MTKAFVFSLLVAISAALPANFDARQQWPGCAAFILNQEDCGSCWSFCSVEAFADRMCITGEAAAGTIVAMEPILECSRDAGCNGGEPKVAWDYMITNGSTTCTSQCFSGCAPYDSGNGKTPKCHQGTCDSGSKWSVTYNGGSFENLKNGDITGFQTELYNNGPLQACFTVYNNFYTYFDLHPDGIYTSESGSVVGGHCVKMIGWGVSGGTDYWLFANSWDTTWGDQGFFKMLKGKNLCGIENGVSEGFTKQQSAIFKTKNVRPIYFEEAPKHVEVGGWYEQTNLEDPILRDAAEEGVKLVSNKIGRDLNLEKILAARTQVVAGVNYEFSVSVDGQALVLRFLRDLSFKYHLTSYHF